MSSGFFTHAIIRLLDVIAGTVLDPSPGPEHQRTGRRGEEDAYFYLRKLGYVMVARNYRSPRRHGEIDIIARDGDTLVFAAIGGARIRYRLDGPIGAPFLVLSNSLGTNLDMWEPQVEHLAMTEPVEHPALGRLDILRNAVRMTDAPATVRSPSPGIGAHTGQVLAELGYSPAEIDRLRAQGVI